MNLPSLLCLWPVPLSNVPVTESVRGAAAVSGIKSGAQPESPHAHPERYRVTYSDIARGARGRLSFGGRNA
ncbi:MAG: hypothetical protein AB3N21_09855 [Ruegeria sp.]|uniref:hypothetical protein n=1 Tax=Ruegeria sp. TaxID=1879320 RepID=UPI00349E709B